MGVIALQGSKWNPFLLGSGRDKHWWSKAKAKNPRRTLGSAIRSPMFHRCSLRLKMADGISSQMLMAEIWKYGKMKVWKGGSPIFSIFWRIPIWKISPKKILPNIGTIKFGGSPISRYTYFEASLLPIHHLHRSKPHDMVPCWAAWADHCEPTFFVLWSERDSLLTGLDLGNTGFRKKIVHPLEKEGAIKP